MTEEQKLEFKRINLAEFAINELKYEPVKEKDTRRWRVLKSPSGTEIVIGSIPQADGTYLFFYQSGGKGGDIFKLLIDEHQKDWKEINEMVAGATVSWLPPPVYKKPEKPKKLTEEGVDSWIRNVPDCEDSPPVNYFTRRKIVDTIRVEFGLGASGAQAVFALYSFNGEKWVADSAITYSQVDNKSFKKFHADKGSSVSVLIPRSKSFFPLWQNPKEMKTPTWIVLFESPVDALSWYQLFEKHLLDKSLILISTLGTVTRAFLKEFPAMAKALNCEKVWLGFDNDENGEKYNKDLLQVLGAAGLKGEVLKYGRFSEYKDWNDVLMKRPMKKD